VIARAALRIFDHRLGDTRFVHHSRAAGFGRIAVVQTKRAAHFRIGAGHGRDRFRLESFILEQAVDRHAISFWSLPCRAGEIGLRRKRKIALWKRTNAANLPQIRNYTRYRAPF